MFPHLNVNKDSNSCEKGLKMIFWQEVHLFFHCVFQLYYETTTFLREISQNKTEESLHCI